MCKKLLKIGTIYYIVWSPLRMGYKIGGSTGHSTMVMLTSQISSTWCIETVRKYVTFRKHLSHVTQIASL